MTIARDTSSRRIIAATRCAEIPAPFLPLSASGRGQGGGLVYAGFHCVRSSHHVVSPMWVRPRAPSGNTSSSVSRP
jgi:hypothetical protein